jgi:hypothetical protein
MGFRGFRSNSQIPTLIPTLIPSEFPRIDVGGRALGQAEKDPAIQTTSTSKVRRVDYLDLVGRHRGPVEFPALLLDWPTQDRRHVRPEERIGPDDITVKEVI